MVNLAYLWYFSFILFFFIFPALNRDFCNHGLFDYILDDICKYYDLVIFQKFFCFFSFCLQQLYEKREQGDVLNLRFNCYQVGSYSVTCHQILWGSLKIVIFVALIYSTYWFWVEELGINQHTNLHHCQLGKK